MSSPFLIAHLVRGEPAFDIAVQQRCSHCERTNLDGIIREYTEPFQINPNCSSCGGKGYWWIVPTINTCSGGWRAFPYWWVELTSIDDRYELEFKDHTFWIDASRGIKGNMLGPPPPPTEWPDFYPESYTAHNKHLEEIALEGSAQDGQGQITNLAERLGLLKPKEPFRRRV